MQIAKDSVVAIDYTLTDDTGRILDTSKDREPLSYLHGQGHIIPGLEAALDGKAAGDEVKVTIPPEQAYGLRDERMIQNVPGSAFSGVAQIQPGMQFQANTPGGPRVVTVVGVEGDQVRIDANHPLAGIALNFQVRIMDVRQASPEELSHGHTHGTDGHHHH
ncbi:MAG: peptidylprolyl isomerase [Tepidisphaeraceae bacterium]|jgi:FKBP-type peptidyl-prolyl cis-trans isomerase SlyD